MLQNETTITLIDAYANYIGWFMFLSALTLAVLAYYGSAARLTKTERGTCAILAIIALLSACTWWD